MGNKWIQEIRNHYHQISSMFTTRLGKAFETFCFSPFLPRFHETSRKFPTKKHQTVKQKASPKSFLEAFGELLRRQRVTGQAPRSRLEDFGESLRAGFAFFLPKSIAYNRFFSAFCIEACTLRRTSMNLNSELSHTDPGSPGT